MNALQFFLTVVVVVISLCGQGMVKIAMNQARIDFAASGAVSSIFISALSNWVFWGALVTIGVGALIYFGLLYLADISRVVPTMGGLAYILMFAFAHYWLQEPISIRQCAGLGFLLIGTYFVAK